jgi:hypothetical protein
MMVGQSSVLSSKEPFALRRWAIKTAAVFEGFSGNFYASERLRRSLRFGQSPSHAAVLLGRYSGRHLLVHTRAVYTDPLNDDAPPTWVTLVLGPLLLCVFSDFDVRPKSTTLTPEAARNFIHYRLGTEGLRSTGRLRSWSTMTYSQCWRRDRTASSARRSGFLSRVAAAR